MTSYLIRSGCCLLFSMLLFCCSESHTPIDKADISYAAIAHGKVDVQGGLLTIAAPPDARFKEVRVKVGDNIKAGDILASLNSEQESLAVDMANAEIQHAQAEVDALTQRLSQTEQLAKRWRAAAAAGAAEQQQADEAQQTFAQLNADIAIAKAAVKISMLKRRQVELLLSQRTLRAPQNAKVIKVFAQNSMTLALNQPTAFILLPEKPFIVRAEVNESFIDKIKPDSTALVSLEASPQNPPIKAKVLRIGSTLEPSHWSDEQAQPSRIVECVLTLEQQQHLLVGQNVMVKFNE